MTLVTDMHVTITTMDQKGWTITIWKRDETYILHIHSLFPDNLHFSRLGQIN